VKTDTRARWLELVRRLDGLAVAEHDLGLNAMAPSAFGVGPSGQIYVALLGGTVYHLAETP